MTVPATAFLGSARSRLLPASVPFRFFGAAVGFHVLAWLALLPGAHAVLAFRGGPGWPLAALHLATLGVLTMTAIGASLQLLPVATRQRVAAPRLLGALWWVAAPGVLALCVGMAWVLPRIVLTGAVLVVLALVAYALLLGRNLARARGMALVVTHGWAAVCSLFALLVSGLSLVAAFQGVPGLDRALALALHLTYAPYGFMGLLVMGLAYILLPMFALAEPPEGALARASAGAALAGLAAALPAAIGLLPRLLWPLAIGTGLLALTLHVVAMEGTLRRGLRPRLGRPLALMRVGWGGLAASLCLALWLAAGAPPQRVGTLFGALVVLSLLSFLFGVFSRVLPFLASMHAVPGRRGPPLPSALTDDAALAAHFACHLVAAALLLAALTLGEVWLVRAAGMVGAAGALAYARFFVVVVRRMRSGHGA